MGVFALENNDNKKYQSRNISLSRPQVSLVFNRFLIKLGTTTKVIIAIRPGADWPIRKSGIFPMGRSLFGILDYLSCT